MSDDDDEDYKVTTRTARAKLAVKNLDFFINFIMSCNNAMYHDEIPK